MSSKLRKSRIEIRVSDDTKKLLLQAATLEGISLSKYVLNAATEKACQVMEEYNVSSLSKHGQIKLLELLQNPGEPTDAMKNLVPIQTFKGRTVS